MPDPTDPICFLFLCFYCSGGHRDLHSFPTRRSSDLAMIVQAMRCFAASTGGWRARIDSEIVMARGRSLAAKTSSAARSEEHTSELQSQFHLVCRLLLEKKKKHDLHHALTSVAHLTDG